MFFTSIDVIDNHFHLLSHFNSLLSLFNFSKHLKKTKIYLHLVKLNTYTIVSISLLVDNDSSFFLFYCWLLLSKVNAAKWKDNIIKLPDINNFCLLYEKKNKFDLFRHFPKRLIIIIMDAQFNMKTWHFTLKKSVYIFFVH